MREHELWLTALLNRFLAGPADAILNAVNAPHDPAHPWSNWLATVRGRAGWSNGTFTSFGAWMFYFTGGLAVANLTYSDTIFFPGSGTTNTASSNPTKTGWTFGAGFEFNTYGPWTIKFEALVHGIGIGIGLKTPLGLAQFALGENFRFTQSSAKPLDLNKPRFYFSIGANL